MVELESLTLDTAVTALTTFSLKAADYTLAGQGHFLLLFGGNERLHRIEVFRGTTVHQFCLIGGDESDGSKANRRIVVLGGKSVAIVDISNEKVDLWIQETVFPDWLFSCLAEDHLFYFLTAHNEVIVTDKALKVLKQVRGEERSILYSGVLVQNDVSKIEGGALVLAGTVFSGVVVWLCPEPDTRSLNKSVCMINGRPMSGITCSTSQSVPKKCSDQKSLLRLTGHDGVIFSVNFNSKTNQICSTSDDRSARVWQLSFGQEGEWDSVKVELIWTLYGHVARVFRALLLDTVLYTVGEDSRICWWDLKTGAVKKTIESAHGGAPVWSITNNAGTVITGGGDGAIRTWNFQSEVGFHLFGKNLFGNGVLDKEDFPKLISFLRETVLTLSNAGCILSCDATNAFKGNSQLHNDDSLANYALMEVDLEGNMVAFANLHGDVKIFRKENDELSIIVDKKVISGKVFALAISGGKVMVNGCEGLFKVFELNNSELVYIASGVLPAMKQRWFSSVIFLSNGIIVGDRCGGVHLYKTTGDELLEASQSFYKLHGRNGVTDMVMFQGDVWTSGRDGIVRRFSLVDENLEEIQSYKLGVDWAAQLLIIRGEMFVVVFHGSMMSLRNLLDGRAVFEVECGGGHRSWSLQTVLDDILFVFIKDKQMFSSKFPLKRLQSQVITPVFHTQEISVLKHLKVGPQNLIFTAGEDTLVKVHKIYRNEKTKMCERQTVSVLKSHISSVKCIEFSDGFEEGCAFMFTGGGRAQLKVWKICQQHMRSEASCFDKSEILIREVSSFMLKGTDSKRKKPWKLMTEQVEPDPETRFMDMCTRKSSDGKNHLIYVGCSDAVLRIFSFDETKLEIALSSEIQYHEHCILQTILLPGNIKGLMISATTSGSVYLWDTEEMVKNHKPISKHRVQQSGVNRIDARVVDNKTWELVTGGDDQSLVVTKIINNGTSFDFEEMWRLDLAHSAQITGAKFIKGKIVSTSVDQRVNVWGLKQGEGWTLEECKCTSVADIQALAAWEERDKTVVAVAGMGMETIALFAEDHLVDKFIKNSI